jgi:hypothetical protein
LYGTSNYHWALGFFFGAALGAIAALVLVFRVKRPTEAEMEAAVRRSPDKVRAPKPAVVQAGGARGVVPRGQHRRPFQDRGG